MLNGQGAFRHKFGFREIKWWFHDIKLVTFRHRWRTSNNRPIVLFVFVACICRFIYIIFIYIIQQLKRLNIRMYMSYFLIPAMESSRIESPWPLSILFLIPISDKSFCRHTSLLRSLSSLSVSLSISSTADSAFSQYCGIWCFTMNSIDLFSALCGPNCRST